MEIEASRTNSNIERYLLGELNDEERADVSASLADDDTYEKLLLVERRLIDRYLRGELSVRDRRLFEDNYLSDFPERVWKVAVTKAAMEVAPALIRPASEAVRDTRKADWTAGLIAFFKRGEVAYSLSLLAVTLLTFFIIYERRQSHLYREQLQIQLEETQRRASQVQDELNDLRARTKTEQDRAAELTAELQRERDGLARREQELRNQLPPRSSSTGINLAVADLFWTGVKGPGGEQPAAVWGGGPKVALNLHLRPRVNYQLYSVSVNGGKPINNLRSVRTQRGLIIVLNIPTEQLKEGINTITLSGRNVEGQYVPVDGYVVRMYK